VVVEHNSVETHHAVEPLAVEWEALAARTGATPFVHPGWMAAWYRAFVRGRPLVAALRRDGALAAVAALETRWGTLRSATNWHTPEYDVVADSPEAARALADAVIALRPRRLELRFLDGGGLALSAFRAAAAGAGYRLLTRRLEESPYIPITGDWDAHAANLSGTMLKELARRWRQLEKEAGAASFTVETGEAGLDEALEAGFRLEASGWKGKGGTAIVSRPETREFYTEIARWAAERGFLRLAFLSAGERPIAFQFDLELDGVVYHLKPGYDESYARFRPGKLLIRQVVRSAFERGARRYEFLGDADRHKLEWTSSVRERLLLQAFAPRPAGLAELAAFRFGRPAAQRALRAYGRVREQTR
jgi:CelD/BcsL family acetyltransferase involved in cellulose biosynthesis